MRTRYLLIRNIDRIIHQKGKNVLFETNSNTIKVNSYTDIMETEGIVSFDVQLNLVIIII